MNASPVLVDIVLVGGGHAHVYILKMFGMKPIPGVRLTLITKQAMTPYSGMIPGHVAGHYTKKECHVDLVRLAKFCGARLILAEVDAIDRFTKTISLKGPRPDIPYDILTIDIGSTPQSLAEIAHSRSLRRKPHVSAQPTAATTMTAGADDDEDDGFVLTGDAASSSQTGSGPEATGRKRHGKDVPGGGKADDDITSEQAEETLQVELLQNITPVKPIDGFSSRWDTICEAVQSAPAGKTFRLIVVGGGAGGIELSLCMHHRLTSILRQRNEEFSATDEANQVKLTITLLTRGTTILPSHNSRVRKAIMRICQEREIAVHVQHEAIGVLPLPTGQQDGPLGPVGLLECANGSTHPFDDCLWCTQARGAAWLASTGLELDDMGFIKVGDTLESINTPGVFACGDIACVVNQPRPKAGVYAVRQGQPLFDNLCRAARGEVLKPFVQQSSNLAILCCGGGYAVASKGSWLKLEGNWVWHVKDWIDKKWMSMYSSTLPDIEEMMEAMPAPDKAALDALARARGNGALDVLSHAAMRCGGCGSKVGATVLSSVMNRLRAGGLLTVPPAVKKDILVGLDSPDDAAVIRPPAGPGRVTVHTVDFFRCFLDDPYVFGQVAANHALSDCHAMCADAHTALAIVTVPFGLQKEVEETIFQVMAGACRVLQEAGCALVGGHTAEGAELSLGFAVNGIARDGSVLHKGGMQPGDKIIITKAVGTGALFAAHMRGLIEGPAVSNALSEMLKSNQKAARVLRDVGGATCCTDITGFGVAGHLVEMLRASDDNDKFNPHFNLEHKYFGANLDLDSLPIMPGAYDALAQGVTSSLQTSNLSSRRALFGATEDSPEMNAVRVHPSYPLLFDPQTAGGLLATVPASFAPATVAALRRLGFADACVLGTVTEVPSSVERLRVSTARDPATATAPEVVTFRKPIAVTKSGSFTSMVSAVIWPENRGTSALKKPPAGGGRRNLLIGLLLGLATAYIWGAVGRAMAPNEVDMICVPAGSD